MCVWFPFLELLLIWWFSWVCCMSMLGAPAVPVWLANVGSLLSSTHCDAHESIPLSQQYLALRVAQQHGPYSSLVGSLA